MTLTNLANWLKEQIDVGGGIAVGGIEENQMRYIGVYAGSAGTSQRICVGGKKQTKTAVLPARILVHWTESPAQAEKKALELYKLFYGISGVEMDGVHVVLANPGERPEWAGRSKNGVCEYVLRLKLTYERKDEDAEHGRVSGL